MLLVVRSVRPAVRVDEPPCGCTLAEVRLAVLPVVHSLVRRLRDPSVLVSDSDELRAVRPEERPLLFRGLRLYRTVVLVLGEIHPARPVVALRRLLPHVADALRLGLHYLGVLRVERSLLRLVLRRLPLRIVRRVLRPLASACLRRGGLCRRLLTGRPRHVLAQADAPVRVPLYLRHVRLSSLKRQLRYGCTAHPSPLTA